MKFSAYVIISLLLLSFGSSTRCLAEQELEVINYVNTEEKLQSELPTDNHFLSYKRLIKSMSKEEEIIRITISAAGDCTLGTDESFGYYGSFVKEADENGYDFFFQNVKSIFEQDDLTIVNLETTLTDASEMAEKKFRFRGLPEYSEILKKGSIEAVNIANNHIYDYLEKGYNDTLSALESSDIGYFGYEHRYITEIKGIMVGCLGYEGWDSTSSLRRTIKKDIEKLRNDGAMLVIVSFHWGVERDYYPNATQKSLGRHAIDSGADLVLGHHPHVIQGIEAYNGKNIVYSLGNFSFGGNKNPGDKDTFIYQQTFEFQAGQLLDNIKANVIPCSVSSVKNRNNYQPTPLEGEEAEALLIRIEKYSESLN